MSFISKFGYSLYKYRSIVETEGNLTLNSQGYYDARLKRIVNVEKPIASRDTRVRVRREKETFKPITDPLSKMAKVVAEHKLKEEAEVSSERVKNRHLLETYLYSSQAHFDKTYGVRHEASANNVNQSAHPTPAPVISSFRQWCKLMNKQEDVDAEENAIKLTQDSRPKPVALPSPSTDLTPLEIKVVSRRKAPPRRSKRLKHSTLATPKEFNPRGKGQRAVGVEKKTGTYFQVGDIVSMVGQDNRIYYAQLRGFLTNQYCEKSTVITWIVPTHASPPPTWGFDPDTYVFAYDEETPRKLDTMTFVMHAPNDYFKVKQSPYPPSNPQPRDSRSPWGRLATAEKTDHVVRDKLRTRQTSYAADSMIIGIADRSYSPTTSRTGLLKALTSLEQYKTFFQPVQHSAAHQARLLPGQLLEPGIGDGSRSTRALLLGLDKGYNKVTASLDHSP
uniref:GATA zinc finger domain-containing protein 1 n=1 Tax=Timema cristinae TaxID=61476 RepID=A0A7R9CMQ6_TIMCR|nr:unnamed protein product [Timema cristinae]